MYSVIVVDDEKIMRTAVASYITDNCPNFTVDGVFRDGSDALEFFTLQPVDVIITDIRMLNMSGLDLARTVSEKWPKCCIVIISGYSDFGYAKEAMLYGVQSYILKPIDFEELFECLSQVKKKLDRQYAATQSESDLSYENAELFFIYVATGILKSSDEIVRTVESLSLPFSPYTQKIQIADLSVCDNAVQWTYGQESLSIGLCNALQLKLPDFQVYLILRKGWHFFFTIVSKDNDAHWDADAITRDIEELLHIKSTLVSIHQSDNILEMAQTIPHEWFGHMVGKSISVFEKQSIETFPAPDADGSDKELLVHKIKEYIQKNYARDISREDVADAVFVSPSYLSRLFKSLTGMSFMDYLTQVRMNKAIELINTHAKINDIAEKIGYRSRNTFLVNFRQFTSYTPTEYRKKVLKIKDDTDDN